MRERYATDVAHRTRHKARVARNRQLHRARLRDIIDVSKTPCIRCGESRKPCLQFHHRDPTHKLFEIANSVRGLVSIDRLLEEIAKCDVLCANCHSVEHSRR